MRDSFEVIAADLVYGPVNALAQQLGKDRVRWRTRPQGLPASAWVIEALEQRLAA